MSAKIDQKSYLRKYLQNGNKKKKGHHKRNKNSVHSRVKVVDDDVDFGGHNQQDFNEDFTLTGEDAPQIVGIVDDRPPELKAIEDFRSNSKWKQLSSASDFQGPTEKNDKILKQEGKTHKEKTKVKHELEDDDLSACTMQNHDNRKDDDLSPKRRRSNSEEDLSPPRKVEKNSKDFSPARRRRIEGSPSSNRNGDVKKTNRAENFSPVSSNPSTETRRSRWDKEIKRESSEPYRSYSSEIKKKKTLDGKLAGLQSSKTLHHEAEQRRLRENEHFEKMPNEISGRNAEVRTRKTHSKKLRDLEKDEEKEAEKLQRNKQLTEKYNQWGKGLKQIEDYQSKLADAEHEINKPLARYSNDSDLEEMLKQQERSEDPMLEYMREKKRGKAVEDKKLEVPLYKGNFPENRYNIRPGYRWDGVDRSNGYEKNWLDVQSQKKSIQDEAYRYSTEDM